MPVQLLAAVALAIWVYLLAWRGGFWRFRSAPSRAWGCEHAPRVAVVIPARNEEDVIAEAVKSLASQGYAGAFHIFVVDDSSSDRTTEVARAAAPPTVVTVLHASSVPAGWTGKLWALDEGIRASGAFAPEAYLFTDADIVHPPDNLARLVADGSDLASLMATLRCETLPEKALIPAFVFFFFMLYPPDWVADQRKRTAGAAGGCVLVRRAALETAGGVEGIRSEIIDDCSLAAAVKRTGGSLHLGLGRGTQSLRSYATFGEIERMISRTAFAQLGHSALLLAGTLAGMVVTYLAPPALLLTRGPTALAGAVAWAIMSLTYAPALRYYRCSLLWAPGLPLVALFYVIATVHSAIRYWRGSGGQWKGRTQDA